MKRRPTTLVGLLWRLVVLRGYGPLVVLVLAVALFALCRAGANSSSQASEPLRVASFNIEFFPQNDRQVREAFRVIETLEVSALGVQEITDTRRFAREATERLGRSWKFVHQEAGGGARSKLHIGVLYDDRVYELRSVTSRRGTRVDHKTHPTFQVDLRERTTGSALTLLVVHFKAMAEGRATRAKQFLALGSIISAVHRRTRRIVVMGDFNATEPGDRDDLRALAERTTLEWATEELACSAFWERENDCPTSRLDHLLSSVTPSNVAARGGCEAGCEDRSSCPVYRQTVSDHCPVVLELSE